MKRKIKASKTLLAGVVNTLLKQIEGGLMVYIAPSIRYIRENERSWFEEHLLDGEWVKPHVQPKNRLDVIEGIKAFNNIFLNKDSEKGVVIITTPEVIIEKEEFYPVG